MRFMNLQLIRLGAAVIVLVLHTAMHAVEVLGVPPGDVSFLPAGHDAWVVGDEPAIVVDFHGMIDYAKTPPPK